MSLLRVYIGFEPREARAFAVCEASLRKHASIPLAVYALRLDQLRARGLYWRAHETREGQLWDVISERPMSTQFALSRFLVPALCGYEGWALFADCDFMWRADVAELAALADPQYAVMVVKHHYIAGAAKMDAQRNVAYPRKNWSSLMLFNCEHPANRALTPALVNTLPRDDLHAFGWLNDALVGALPFEWNWLELQPKAVHYTEGSPDMPGHEGAAYADEYRAHAAAIAHAHCPQGCEHPQPFMDGGREYCGRCWFKEGVRTEMVLCSPETCEAE